MIALRWLAAAAVVAIGTLDGLWLGVTDRPWAIVAVGGGILAYNIILAAMAGRRRLTPPAFAVLQVALDLACLTLLVAWTGHAHSPVLYFFVFHMVFASLLLARVMAFACATFSVAAVCLLLALTGHWPITSAERLNLQAWGLTLLLTVYLTNHITNLLRRKHARVARANRRNRALLERLRDQQQAMLQHERLVAMGQMAAGIAHEIANPLANIDSLIQLARRNPDRLTPERMENLTQQVVRIRETIRQMSDYAHPASTEWRTMPLGDVVDLGLSVMRYDRRLKRVRIEREASENGCQVRVQPHCIQQVLTNVLINALDAMEHTEEPMLRITTACGEQSGHITIEDNGCGIAPEHAHRVMDPFFTTKPVGRGTGLGLAISYRLVRQQEGELRIDRAAGGGTRVTLELTRPLADPGQAPSAE